MTNYSKDVFIYKNPAKLLQNLIRFNTTNPPGNETESIMYIMDLLEKAHIEVKTFGRKTERQNLYARIKGNGSAPPFLMYGHIDVVTTENQNWQVPPFEGRIKDGCVWGRGALDMKGALAMMIAAFLRIKVEALTPSGDIILCIVTDEEDEGYYGARYMVEEHPELFEDVQFAIGEIGGFTLHMDHKRFYPIMISEKQKCALKTIIKGPGGHGSMPIRDGAMAKLAYVLERLNTKRLPVHITPPVKQMIEALSSNMSFPANKVLRQLLNTGMSNKVLNLLGSNGYLFDPLLHNTVNATIVKGGNKINVIPSEITLEFDGRLLPGYKPDDLVSELNALLGSEHEFEVTFYYPGPDSVNMDLFNTLSSVLCDFDSEAIPIPFVGCGVTDARYFSKLGIQTYGFTPMILPEEINFSKLIHSADERIPVEAMEFGSETIYELLKRLSLFD
ncbi:M20/M25/M40 family metallo-hydrolase [Vallitalea okinawensis]|uniref:M20/M25/M40 family metallo-hydrolase n=1 Tax=Vallitalea okinawensis TaxID=2078660 RepID=UPI000CFCA9C1|nr:M20/M25/M40 family metallo-hydrolase [Vallitalea okinawensis]